MAMQPTPYPAPDFSLNGVSLKGFRGRWVVLYFYPKDDTPGCTVEACSLRDARDELAALGAEVIGISMDPPEVHEKFKAKHNLHFHLLSDPEKTVITAYGAWGPKMFGREGILRRTFLIDPDGVVQKVYGRVTPLGHGEQVVAELRRLQATEK